LTGIICGQAKRSPRTIYHITDQFSRLLLLSEHRGPHATGAAWVKRDGTMRVLKAPLPARAFIQTAEYLDWLLEIDNDVTYLMGHTRWPTRGSERNPANNHPLVAQVELGAASSADRALAGHGGTAVAARDNSRQTHFVACSHNGFIRDPDGWSRRLALPRTAQVDSELLVRLAQRHAGADGLNLPALLADIAPLEGRMSCALVATTKPEEVILLRGNMPLEVRLHRRQKLLAYASEAAILARGLTDDGCATVPVAEGEGLVVDAGGLARLGRCRVPFRGMAAR
jgi:glucosamine 6-phosphate synthetase-like amidotransferase/phosphosugar isomerase protein